MRDALIKLLKVKSLVTFAVISVFAYLAVCGRIQPDDVMLIVTSVVAFYFGTQSEKQA